MATFEQIRILERFNEKVARLERLRLHEAGQTGAIVEWKKEIGWEGVHVGPPDESVEAVVLSLRFFLQNNEPTSLFNMNSLYQTLGVSPVLVAEFQDVRNTLNALLDRPTPLSIEENSHLTHRDIFEMFLWGDLSHANKEHEDRYQAISKTPFFPLFQSVFISVVRDFIQALRVIRNINRSALDELRSKP
jgi:hypothetical protein